VPILQKTSSSQEHALKLEMPREMLLMLSTSQLKCRSKLQMGDIPFNRGRVFF